MVRFKTAAVVCSLFVILGAVKGGGGTTHTLGELGAVNALGGAFVVALAAALTVGWMTRLRLPVSTSQAVVGAIIGWNIYSGHLTDNDSLWKIISTWILCPVLAGIFAALLYSLMRFFIPRTRIHLLQLDMYTRIGLVLVGAFGAYSLGANNIANVVGVFVPAAPLEAIRFNGQVIFTSAQVLFFLGGLAIAAGVLTYSHKVFRTVGSSLMKLSPEAALVVVLAHSLVLFLFASQWLESLLQARGLPTLPLVPVSSSQAVVGAVLGIGLVKGGKGIRFRVLGEIASGWVTTPICAGVLSFVALFVLQNVFDQHVAQTVCYRIDQPVIEQLERQGLSDPGMAGFVDREYQRAVDLESELSSKTNLDRRHRVQVVEAAECAVYRLEAEVLDRELDPSWFTPAQIQAVQSLADREFQRRWQFLAALEEASEEWRISGDITRTRHRDLKAKREFVLRAFRVLEYK